MSVLLSRVVREVPAIRLREADWGADTMTQTISDLTPEHLYKVVMTAECNSECLRQLSKTLPVGVYHMVCWVMPWNNAMFEGSGTEMVGAGAFT